MLTERGFLCMADGCNASISMWSDKAEDVKTYAQSEGWSTGRSARCPHHRELVVFVRDGIEVLEKDGEPVVAFCFDVASTEAVEAEIDEHYGRDLAFGLWVPAGTDVDHVSLPWAAVSLDHDACLVARIEGEKVEE
jgi:hypothetical protein